MLELKNITKRYRGIPVVKNMSFDLRAGEILGCVGPNGSGKSTTVKMILGLIEPTEGEILFRGQNVQKDLRAFRAHVGYIPEEAEVYSHLSGLEYLQLVGRLRGIPERLLLDKARALLQTFSLGEAQYSPISQYSKGMKQRVLISAALIHYPDLFIFDEPLSGLDAETSRLFKDLLIALANDGKAILYISHVLEVVEIVCDRVMIVAHGSMIANGPPRTLLSQVSQPTLESAFTQIVGQTDTLTIANDLLAIARQGTS